MEWLCCSGPFMRPLMEDIFARQRRFTDECGIWIFAVFFDAVSTFEPSHVVCCWDMGKGTFRTEKYDGYKSNRIEAPLELIPQFDLVKEVVAELGVPNIGLAYYEADDCIGTLASCYSDNSEVYILTGDHDMLQLIDENVKVVIMKKDAPTIKFMTLQNCLRIKV